MGWVSGGQGGAWGAPDSAVLNPDQSSLDPPQWHDLNTPALAPLRATGQANSVQR
jgi:hypothetical protein